MTGKTQTMVTKKYLVIITSIVTIVILGNPAKFKQTLNYLIIFKLLQENIFLPVIDSTK